MSPKVTLYVRPEDQATWDRARAEAGDVGGLSQLVSQALRVYLESRTPKTPAERELHTRILRVMEDALSASALSVRAAEKKPARRRASTRRKA